MQDNLAAPQQILRLPLQEIDDRPLSAPLTLGQLRPLVESIRREGLREPLVVRRAMNHRYTIVQGSRRLAACRACGLREAPAVLLPVSPQDREAIWLLDQLPSGGKTCLQEAEVLSRLHINHGLSLETLSLAATLPVNAICRKISLMELSPDVRERLARLGHSERLALALLKLPNDSARLSMLAQVENEHLSTRDAELLIGSMQRMGMPLPRQGRTMTVIRDERLYLNAFRSLVAQMRQSGLRAELLESSGGGCTELYVKIRTRRRRQRFQDPAQAAAPCIASDGP